MGSGGPFEPGALETSLRLKISWMQPFACSAHVVAMPKSFSWPRGTVDEFQVKQTVAEIVLQGGIALYFRVRGWPMANILSHVTWLL